MKDKLLFGTIGLLVGIVVMQWTMPSGQATIMTVPVGNIVAIMGEEVLGTDDNRWVWSHQFGWENRGPLPVPASDVRFIVRHIAEWSYAAFVDKDGNWWLRDSTTPDDVFVNHGQPPIAPVSTSESTWGKIKSTFSSKGDKP